MTRLVLAAPLSGWASRLDEVPDPAFAQGLIGDGVAIDPTSSELRAPCDGVVVSVHRARHACTLRSEGGAEILLHIGVDTVELNGQGFQPLVAGGQRVRTGDPLIRFDLERISRKARSLHTLVVLVGGEGLEVVERAVDREVTAGDFVMAVGQPGQPGQRAGTGPTGPTDPADPSIAPRVTRSVRLLVAHGLHARPAAAFARHARQYEGEVTVACGDRSANGKSVISLMALDVRLGDELAITATGSRAELAAGTLAELVASGLGDPIATAAGPPANGAPRAELAMFAPGDDVALAGAAAAAGIATGRAVRLAGADPSGATAIARDGAGPPVEHARLTAALGEVSREIAQTVADATARGDAAAADIFRAHLELLGDPELVDAAAREIAAGRSAAWAWRATLDERAAVLRGLGNPLLAERSGDLGDLERRTLARLTGTAGRMPAELPEGAILVADELAPSELAAVPAGRLAGLCTARGGATSHVAILAAGLGVPAVVALGDAALRIPDGAPLIVDGDRGSVRVFPAPATHDAVQRAIAGRAARRRAALAAAQRPARTTDGVEIAVYANLGKVSEARTARELGADGCGLLRTEFLFLDRAAAPGEDEQAACYQQIADALDGRPLVIRTLDAGGDKPLPYLPGAREDNPALGVRGVRLGLRHPELLRAQLRAILRVVPGGVCRIIVPMIASPGELRAVRDMLDEERRALGVAAVPLGAMIEVPVAALGARALAADCELFSIGTNDLAQYALARDRGNHDVAAGLDSLEPGVLQLIASTVRGAELHDRPVSVCGGAAADPCAAAIFVGLGIRTLSVAPAALPELKAWLRTLSAARAAELASRALELDSAGEVRALIASALPDRAAPPTQIETTPPRQPLSSRLARRA